MRRPIRLLIAISLIIAAAFSSGCGTLSIGRPPSELDLVNDGTGADQIALEKKYALAYRQGYIERPGVTVEEVEREVNLDVSEVRVPAWSDEADDYISSSPVAGDVMDTALVGFDRFTHSGTPTLMIEAGGVLIGAAAGATTAWSETGTTFEAGELGHVTSGLFNGALFGLIVTIPVVIVYEFVVPPLASSLASSDYRKAVRAFNQDLERRVQKSARAPAPLPAPAPAPAGGSPPSG